MREWLVRQPNFVRQKIFDVNLMSKLKHKAYHRLLWESMIFYCFISYDYFLYQYNKRSNDREKYNSIDNIGVILSQ